MRRGPRSLETSRVSGRRVQCALKLTCIADQYPQSKYNESMSASSVGMQHGMLIVEIIECLGEE